MLGNHPTLKWRRPDVYAEYNGRKYVFELQLSTTFVSVIVDRDIFYRLNDYNIIWIFNFEDNEEYVNLYNLMCKDIYYANKRNVFIFDTEAEEKSKENGELVLKAISLRGLQSVKFIRQRVRMLVSLHLQSTEHDQCIRVQNVHDVFHGGINRVRHAFCRNCLPHRSPASGYSHKNHSKSQEYAQCSFRFSSHKENPPRVYI